MSEQTPLPSSGSPAAERSVLVLRAYSGGFETQAERTTQVPAEVVVFDDGVVVADVGVTPQVRYAAFELSDDELESLRDVLDEVDPTGYFVPYDPSFHVVSEMTIIQVHGPGPLIEVMVAGLMAAIVRPPPDYVPPWVAALDIKVTELRDLVRAGGGIEFAGEIPTVDGVELIPGQARKTTPAV